LRKVLATAAGVVLLCGLLVHARAQAHPTANPIVRENALAGTADWQRTVGGDIQVYGSQIAGAPGDGVGLHVSTRYRYRILVYRLGWYQGAGARQVACLPGCTADEPGALQAQPGTPPAPQDAPPIRANWPVTDTVSTDASWTTGYYLVEALLTSGPSAGDVATTFFVLHEPSGSQGSEILVQVPVNTWEAYNSWGGRSLYEFTGPRMARVSFDRPFGYLAQSPFWWEIQLVRFLEREGYDVSYQTDIDTNNDPSSLLRHRLVVVAGHDEYWTSAMRDAFDAAVAAGTNLAFIGSNDAYWHVEYEDGGRTIFGYKSLLDPNPVLAQKTALWREIGRPECVLMGVQHQFLTRQSHSLDYTVTAAGAADPWLAGTSLEPGDTVVNVVGREHDVLNPYPASCFHSGLVVLFHYDGQGTDQNADAVRFTAQSGARIFASGAQKFSWALDDWRPDGAVTPPMAVASDRTAPADPRVQQFMRNALDDLTRPAPPSPPVVTTMGRRLHVSIAPDHDPRDRGFVAAERVGSNWLPVCRGITDCAGRLPVTSASFVIGVVSVDEWGRNSAASFAVVTSHR
jgi:hypothetical protein